MSSSDRFYFTGFLHTPDLAGVNVEINTNKLESPCDSCTSIMFVSTFLKKREIRGMGEIATGEPVSITG